MTEREQERVIRDLEGQRRLFEFIQGEVREMHVLARLRFAKNLLTYLTPEISELVKNTVAAREGERCTTNGGGPSSML